MKQIKTGKLIAAAVLLLVNLSIAQSSKDEITAQDSRSDIKRVIYKQIGTLSLSMQVYPPTLADTTQRAPVMVFFFGGGWEAGTIKQFEPHARYFSQRGIVCFLADYRVSSRHHTTPFASLEDAKSAIRYIKKHSQEFHVDTTRIIASGGSAGGQLAAATALTKGFNDPTYHLAYSARPDALVLFNPVSDNGPGGYGYERVQERYRDFSPLHNIHEGAPPTIIFLGTQDQLIPVETAERYKRKMEEVGSRCEVVLYKGQGHGFFNYRNQRYYQKTVSEADRFLMSLGFLDAQPEIEFEYTEEE